jgi:hypothetical protein
MILFPEVLKKAQAEIDAVVGNDRLPSFSDRENLPYVDALVKEVFRWHSVAPTGENFAGKPWMTDDLFLGVAHRVMEDDVHEGYFIPRGALIIANIWFVQPINSNLNDSPGLCLFFRQLTHDPRIYANPVTFDPSRFLASEGRTPEPDPREICFGFGRRYVLQLLIREHEYELTIDSIGPVRVITAYENNKFLNLTLHFRVAFG